MDIIILICIASTLLLLIISIAYLAQKNAIENDETFKPQPEARIQQGQNRQGPRRAVAVRNTRARLSAQVRQNRDSDDTDELPEDQEVDNDIDFGDGKLGAKKRAKLEAKADRQKQREAEERNRDDKKKKQELEDAEREKLAALEKLEEAKRLEEEKKAREEKEKQEHEEYLKMKEMFSVEEEGCEVAEEEEQKNLLQEFITYIKSMKVVVLEDLAAHFKLKTQNVIDRIQDLQLEGSLTGVLDDRGKFIFISQEELEAVAKFVTQRGRVSITDLAESSNRLINLKSTVNASTS